MPVTSCIPIIPSANLEKSLRLWRDGFGFSMSSEMREDDRLIFCMYGSPFDTTDPAVSDRIGCISVALPYCGLCCESQVSRSADVLKSISASPRLLSCSEDR